MAEHPADTAVRAAREGSLYTGNSPMQDRGAPYTLIHDDELGPRPPDAKAGAWVARVALVVSAAIAVAVYRFCF